MWGSGVIWLRVTLAALERFDESDTDVWEELVPAQQALFTGTASAFPQAFVRLRSLLELSLSSLGLQHPHQGKNQIWGSREGLGWCFLTKLLAVSERWVRRFSFHRCHSGGREGKASPCCLLQRLAALLCPSLYFAVWKVGATLSHQDEGAHWEHRVTVWEEAGASHQSWTPSQHFYVRGK